MKQSHCSRVTLRAGERSTTRWALPAALCSFLLAFAMAGGVITPLGVGAALADEVPVADQPADQPAEPIDQPAEQPAEPVDPAADQPAAPVDETATPEAAPADVAEPGANATISDLFAYAENTTAAIPTGDTVQIADTAGNVLVATDGTGTSDSSITTARDLVWFGNDLTADGAVVGGDIIAAGNNISISNAQVTDDIRMAGNTLSISSTTAGGNVTLAGSSVVIEEDVSAAGVALAAANARFEGTADALYMAAGTVALSGTVNGDAEVWGGAVTIDDDARIAGTLRVHAPSEPRIPDSATIGEFEFVADESLGDTTVTIGPRINISWSGNSMFGIISTALTLVVCAVLLSLLLRRGVESCARRTRAHLGATITSGFIAFLAGLPAAVLLMIAVVTLPLGLALLLMSFIVMCICVPFTAAVLGSAILPRMHRALSALIVSVLLAAALILTGMYVPIATFIIGLLCFIFMLGCLVQALFVGMHDTDFEKAPEELVSAEYHPSGYGSGAAGSQGPANPSQASYNGLADDWTKY